jgi:tRNA uridine 5-carbamoylmethylation protein Kti12
MLKKIAEINYLKMEEITTQKFDNLPWDEKEKTMERVSEISENIDKSIKDFSVLDAEYANLRERVNTFYGKEIMKDLDFTLLSNINQMQSDPADWWKKL